MRATMYRPLVVGYEITNDRNDVGKLCGTAEMAKENTGKESIEAIADKGYESRKDIEKCLMNGIVPDVGFAYDREFRVFNIDYIAADITAEEKASEKKEDIQACLHAGILPDVPEPLHRRERTQERKIRAGDRVCAGDHVWLIEISITADPGYTTAEPVQRIWARRASGSAGNDLH